MFAKGVELPNILVLGRQELKVCSPTHFPSHTRPRSHPVAVQRGTWIGPSLAEIGSQPDKEPEPGVADDAVHSGTIRCVAGRTELDFAVATILAQLLIRKGCRAEVIANPAVSRGNIGRFSQEDVSLVGVCYIDFSGAIAPIRFLLIVYGSVCRKRGFSLLSGHEIMRSHAIAIFRTRSM